ncbi:MAG: hypothetical protein KF789_10200 [Bdellovibrionaceae bacterium]|nr:hypothetical protein [Pseudobdellovibrionaceae bacterium]
MNKKFLPLIVLMIAGCSSKSPKDADIKDQSIQTARDKSEMVSGGTVLGVNDDKDVIVQEKVQLTEHLRQLVTTIRHKQDELYGSQRFGTRGLYGKLEKCVAKASKKEGVAHKVLAAREIIMPEQELGNLEAGKFGYDEKGNLVALDEVKLRDKIRDLESKKRKLYEKEEELLAEMSRCEAVS